MFEEEKKNDNLIMKWTPILDMVEGLKKEDYLKLSQYCENHLRIETEKGMIPAVLHQKEIFSSTLPHSLKVLSKLDLSKVDFSSNPVGVYEDETGKEQMFAVSTYQVGASMDQYQIHEMAVMGIDILVEIESVIIEVMTEQLIKSLEENKKIIFFQVISDISKLDETNRIVARSRYWPKSNKEKQSGVTIDDL